MIIYEFTNLNPNKHDHATGIRISAQNTYYIKPKNTNQNIVISFTLGYDRLTYHVNLISK